MIKREFDIFLTAIMFYTILPTGKNRGFSEVMLGKSTRYYPLTGLVVGAFSGLSFWLTLQVLPLQVAVVLSMLASVFITKAFHEDGLADFCDGFGGGYSKERILAIMKDSCIGTYGTVALVLMMLLKFAALSNIPPAQICWVLVAANGVSRILPVVIMYTTSYARTDGTSKIGAIAQKGSIGSFCVALFFGSVGLALLPLKTVLLVVPFLVVLFVVFRRYLIRQIGGYTGDTLGALQQLAEVTIYMSFLVSCKG